MENGCKVEVNGEGAFIIDKNVLQCFGGRFSKLCKKTGSKGGLKLILHGFPGGGDGFELLVSFLCNNGDIEITPYNLVLLNSAADFMEIDLNLRKFPGGIDQWNWSELVLALKQCQDMFLEKDSSFLTEKTLDSVIGRIVSITVASPFTCCSSENFSSQLSSDTSSSCSTRNISSKPSWFEDLSWLNARFFEKLVKMMVVQNLDHCTIFKFLIFYLKSSLRCYSGQAEKRRVIDVVICLLPYLKRSSLSCKGLFEILRMVSRVRGKHRCSVVKLERLIGSKLDQATIDQLMISSASKKYSVYDVDLVLRLVQVNILECLMLGMKKIGSLIDSYLLEVAADFRLKPSKFAALVMVLPDSARESNDKLYQAIDLYLQVHTQLCEEEKMRICFALNHGKLSQEALKHLARNSKFPSRKAIENFIVNLHRSDDLNYKNICMSRKKCAGKHEYLKEIGNGIDSHLHRDCGKIESKSKKMPCVMRPRKCNSARIRYLPSFC